ncbi:hypothetical protein D3C85_1531580 [compost metagenome]
MQLHIGYALFQSAEHPRCPILCNTAASMHTLLQAGGLHTSQVVAAFVCDFFVIGFQLLQLLIQLKDGLLRLLIKLMILHAFLFRLQFLLQYDSCHVLFAGLQSQQRLMLALFFRFQCG